MENNNNLLSGQSSGSNPVNNTGLLPPPTPPKGKLPPPAPPKKNSGKSSALLVITLVLSAALIASLIYIYMITKQSQEELAIANEEKQEVISNLEQLKTDYGELRVSNDTLNAQLNSERKKLTFLWNVSNRPKQPTERKCVNTKRK
jgi:hypothetical protein